MLKNIPASLKNLPNWVVWKKEKRNGKETKVPYDAKSGEYAKSNDAATWTTFEDAEKVAGALSEGKYDGIGFMLHGEKFVGIDFDGVVDDGIPEAYTLNIISQLGSPYVEITPSGTGLRVFVECPALPPGLGRKFAAKKKGVTKYGAEIYAGNEGGRYLTVTGDHYSGEGIPVIPDLELVCFLISKFADIHFQRLWMGDTSDYENDDSRADLALLGLFIRAFNGDQDKALRFFKASVPGHREKWVKREDYRNMTLARALSGQTLTPTAWKKFVDQPRHIIEFRSEPPTEEVKAKWGAFDYVVNAIDRSEHNFEGWFPLGSPSLVGGSSGSGKTTWMLDLCVKQAIGAPVHDHSTLGRPYIVLMLDRGQDSHTRTMKRLGFVTNQVPIKFLKAAVDGEASQQIIDLIESADPRPEFVFIEGMDMLVSDPNSLNVVMPFMHEMQVIAERFHIALVGSLGAPKTKPKEGYAAKRDTIFGSAVWSRMAETIITLQYPGGDDTDSKRSISVLPRNAKAEQFDMEFQHGKLEITVPPPEISEPHYTQKEKEEQRMIFRAEGFIVKTLEKGALKGTAVIRLAGEEGDTEGRIGINAIKDASALMVQKGRLEKIHAGKEGSMWKLLPLNGTAEAADARDKAKADARSAEEAALHFDDIRVE